MYKQFHRKLVIIVSEQHTTPKIPTPEPIAVSVGIISNFLACEGQSATDLKLPLTS